MCAPECGFRARVLDCTRLANNGFGGSVIIRAEIVTAPTISKFRICMFARHKQAWLTGEKKKSKSKLVSVSMAKERAFYTVSYTILILTRVGPLCRGMRSFATGLELQSLHASGNKLLSKSALPLSGNVLLVT